MSVKGDKGGQNIRMILPKFKDIEIYFGCKRLAGKTDYHQPKDISKRWFIRYNFLVNGIYQRLKVKGGINRFHTVETRFHEAKILKDSLLYLLTNGYNPVENELESQEMATTDPAELIRQLPIIDGLKWAFEKHSPHIAPKTRTDYNGILNYVYKAITELNYSKLTVDGFKKSHLRVVMDHLQTKNNLSNNRYNAYVEYLKGVYKSFLQFDVFDVSPIATFERLKELEAKSFETLTSDERLQVYVHLAKVHPDFLIYFLLIYHTALRPKELVSLQISNYHEASASFVIEAGETINLLGETHSKTKTQKRRYVAIPPEAMELLKSMNLKQFPNEYFIFSTGFKPGSVNIDRKRATEIWHREVITKLKINKKMYGVKHLGIDDKLENDTSIDAIQSQAGHTTKEMTKRYSKKLKEVYQKEINKKSKGFLEE